MRILLATSSFKGGGISSYAHEVINLFSNENEMIVMVGSQNDMPIRNNKVKVYECECQDVSFHNLLKVIDIINNEIKPNVIISNNADVISVLAPFINDDIRIITLSHSLKYIEADKSAMTEKYVDKIIAASSQFNKDYLIKKFNIKDESKIEVIYNFVEAYVDAFAIREKKKKNKVVTIVFPGGGYPSKSPDIVLNVLTRLLSTDLQFKFYWTGNTHIFLSGLSLCKSKKDIKYLVPKDSRVCFTGRLPHREDVTKIYADANIFFTPSRREGCPISLLEAMRVGTIPIVTDYPNSNKEIVEDGINGFVIPHNDIEGFVNRIVSIIEGHQKYEGIYDKSFETFEEKLSFPIWKEKMETILLNGNLYHKKRTKLSRTRLLYYVLRLKYYELQSLIYRVVEESLPVYIKLTKQK